ncbi:phage portal protein [Bifidobacterium phasiani]|uniref:Phage portal protein n=1 Tax=Bifidobacterium phasiani TaxID=2834431 RepID=A0ABS6W8C4_9BIFI|nr:phage portal protein [Bifidobacterium phasiani]MBW3081977.1 phage portal protein [Bifidobacterium phasiani]
MNPNTPFLSTGSSRITSIRGMDGHDLDTIQRLLDLWRRKYPRNLLRTLFYDGKQRFRNLGISIPPSIAAKAGNVVGWPRKSVRALADKSAFEGFEISGPDTHGITEICESNELTWDVGEAIISCYKHSCSFLTIDYDPDDTTGERILITPRSADWSVALWDTSRRRIGAALTITACDDNGAITTFNAWLPGRNYACRREAHGWWTAERQDNRLDRVAVVPFVHDRQMDRPFGRSRINRTLMNLTDMAMRTMVRMEANAEFYSAPKLWFLGLDSEAFDTDTWSALVSSINTVSRDIDNNIPDMRQVTQASMQPHGDMLETIAMLASAETDIPPENLGIRVTNPTSAEALAASENQLTRTANRQNRFFGVQLINAMRMAVQLRDNTAETPDLSGVRPIWAPTREVSDAARADYYQKVAAVNGDWGDSDVGLARLGLGMDEIRSLRAHQQRMRAQQNIDRLRRETGVTGTEGDDGAGDGTAEDAAGTGARTV